MVTINAAIGGRHPRPGGRRHDRRQPVLRHRRPRGLHRRPRALARGPRAALPALDGRRSAASAARGSSPGSRPAAVITTPAPPGRRDRHRVRRRRAPGQDRPPARPRRSPRSPTRTSATSCSRRRSAPRTDARRSADPREQVAAEDRGEAEVVRARPAAETRSSLTPTFIGSPPSRDGARSRDGAPAPCARSPGPLP